uniref:Uncharacterized protein n=1 Tax=Arundo donax TaxID=35708 RepID=A0A0A8ZFE6_ARUDO
MDHRKSAFALFNDGSYTVLAYWLAMCF